MLSLTQSRMVSPLLISMAILIAGCSEETQEQKSLSRSEDALQGEARRSSVFREELDFSQDHESDRGNVSLNIQFVEVAKQLGIEFIYDRGARGNALMSEAVGGGAGWLDYDRDGRMDLYLVQAGEPVELEKNTSDQIFRQSVDGQFAKVFPANTGLWEQDYGQGVSIADFDNDGFDDIYVTNIGGNRLWKNQGDGTFQDVTDFAGVAGTQLWSSSCAWGDLNHDGMLDLFVCQYLDYDPAHPVPCYDNEGNRATCDPNEINAVPNDCFLNRGDGSFEQIASTGFLRGEGGKSLGVAISDLDQDGKIDIYVANDTTANFLFINGGNLNFQEQAVARGCAMSGLGQLQASMGIAVGDYNRDGMQDLYLTHFESDSNTLYENLGNGLFRDSTRRTGIHRATVPHLGFGTVIEDFNRDGRADLLIANGHIDDWRSRGKPWKMPTQIFTFVKNRWQEIGIEAGTYFSEKRLGRAVATADFDADGDLDFAIVNQDQPMALLRNDSPNGPGLMLEFVGIESNRSGIGVSVIVENNDERLRSELPGGTSYCSSHQHLLNLGFKNPDGLCRVEIHWPSGHRDVVENVSLDQKVTFLEGKGIVSQGAFSKEVPRP